MVESDTKSSFDRLVAGLNAEDRLAMLNRINQMDSQNVQLSAEPVDSEANITIQKKLQNESVFYKLILWLRALFDKKTIEQLYGQDLINNLSRKINSRFPGTIDTRIKSLDYIFYERLLTLKEAADFFKVYFTYIEEAPGDFYVFLSSFVAPELAEKINAQADPFIFPFSKPVTPEARTELAKKLDDLLNNMDRDTKANMYSAVSSANWLNKFCMLQYLHFISQFTNIAGDAYTCPYSNSQMDYNELASVFSSIKPIENEVLEAIFLFSQRKHLTTNAQDKDIEKAVKEFMIKAVAFLGTIKSFVNNVPIKNLGRVVNQDYNWQPKNMEGAEAWFPSFRAQWRKIQDIRWNDFAREQKKQMLSQNLKTDFDLDEFPTMEYRPWLKLWNRIPFNRELTGGFLSWFCTEKYDKIIPDLNLVAMEGVFYKSENRSEYSEGLNNFSNANVMMKELLRKLSPEGEYGRLFDDFATNRVHNFQVQNQIESMMTQIEDTVKEAIALFGKGARTIERVFYGFFEEQKDGIHEPLQNITTIRGRDNRRFLDSLISTRQLLKKTLSYISELEPIDSMKEN
ncbi:MAG: hypothetical protein J5687_07550 [Treponema sp.]|nr:hypothetical protein [Treponema sp.]